MSNRKRFMSMRAYVRSAAVAVLMSAAFNAIASIGVVQFTSGDVKIRNAAGEVRAAVKGGVVNEGDTLLTAASASAQLKMSDGGVLAIRPETELKVDTYRYAGKEDGNERAAMSLVKGGFRTITGIIGRTNKQNYTINTPTAVIGIRGTDHEPIVIPVIAGVGKPPAPPGTYDKVNVGQAFIRTPLGEVNIRQNQVGYAAPNQAPTLLPKVPDMFKATPPVRQAQAEKKDEKQEQQKQQDAQKQDGQKQEAQKQEQQKQEQTKQAGGAPSGQSQTAASGEKAADTQTTQTASSASTSTSSSTTSTTGTTAATAATTEIRATAVVDATPSTASTGVTSTTTAVVPTTTTVAPAVTTITTTTAPPAVVQTVTATSTSTTSASLNLTTQTTTSSSGTTTTLTNTAVATTTTPSVTSGNYGALVMGQAPVTTTSKSVEGVTFKLQPESGFVLDQNKALTEIKHIAHVTSDTTGLLQVIDDVDLKQSNGKFADVHVHPDNTMYIGRQEGGSILVTPSGSTAAPFTQPLNSSSAHWLIALQPAQTALSGGVGTISNAQKVVGTSVYTTAAATHPTDLRGNVGTLTGGLLTANFSSQTVTALLDVKFATGDANAVSARNLEIFGAASDVPIKLGGFEATAGTATAPHVSCIGADCSTRNYQGTIRGMFGAPASGGAGLGTAVGIGYSFGPVGATGGTAFDDLIQGTAVLSSVSGPPAGGITNTFANNSNVRHELVYDTLPPNSSGKAFIGVARDSISLTNPTAQTVDGVRSNVNYLFDAGGNLVRIFSTPYAVFDHSTNQASTTGFSAPTPLASATVSMGGDTATSANLFSDSAMGVQLGRWKGGALTVTDLSTGNGYVEDLANRSVHWLVRSVPTSMPVSGVYHYLKAAGTDPTDSYGNVGTLDRARLTADFNRMRVSAGVSITINSGAGGALGRQSLGGNFADVPFTGSGFNVSSNPNDNPGFDYLHVSCIGAGCAPGQSYGGRIRGGFASGTGASGAAEGGFFRYTFNTNYGQGSTSVPSGRVADDYVTGLVAFKQGSQAVAPGVTAATPAGVLATYTYSDGNLVNATRGYRVDDAANLSVDSTSGLIAVTDDGDTSGNRESLSIASGGAASVLQAGNFTSTGITYGRRSGLPTSALTGREQSSGTFTRTPLSDGLAWVKGPGVYPFYLSEALATISSAAGTIVSGTANFTLDGATVNDRAGKPLTGVTAALGVDFNRQAVGFDITVPTSSGNWVAKSAGSTTGGAANPGVALDGDGGFRAFTGSEVTTPSTASTHRAMTMTYNNTTAGGSVEGQLMGQGINGAGMVFNFNSASAGANGALAFTNPTPFSTLTPYRLVGIAAGMNNLGSQFSEENYAIMGGAVARNRVGTDADGVLTKVDAEYPVVSQPSGCSTCKTSLNHIPATYSALTTTASGGVVVTTATATAVDRGSDVATGLSWGRYTNGTINVVDRISGASLGTVSANTHYIISPQLSGPTVLPVTGVFNYTKVGGTNPTDNLGNVGVLNSATFKADFGAGKVDSAVNLTVNSSTWSATATGVSIQKGTFFEAGKSLGATTGPLTVTRTGETNAANLAGKMIGVFAGSTGQGAALLYSLNHGGHSSSTSILPGGGTTVSGVVGFKR